MKYERLLKPDKHGSSAFIFGPRMTGKTFLLRELSTERYYDLLDPQTELAFRHRPETFGQEVLLFP
jgi:predicted AAA+ superfamily ATPase